MSRNRNLFLLAALVWMGTATAQVGTTVDPFVLETVSGEEVSLYRAGAMTGGTVLAFLPSEGALLQPLAEQLVSLDQDYRSEGFRFFGVSAPGASRTELQTLKERLGIQFPILMDTFGTLVGPLKITRNAEVLLLDDEFNVRYRGAIDDRFQGEEVGDEANDEYLIEAIEALIEGIEIDVPSSEPAGAPMDVQEDQLPEVTFHRDIAPILYNKCVECHRKGEIGPMSLLSYKEVRGWAPMIEEVTDNGRMPPWSADPRFGKFSNERYLTNTEKALFARWASTGAKEGDPADGPEVPTFESDEWGIGIPDAIFQIPEPQEIPAEGVVPYRFVTIDPQLTEDHYIQAIEVRPTAPEVTHHVIAFAVEPGEDPRAVFRRNQAGAGSFAGYVPGSRPEIYPDGVGKYVKAGTTLLLQLHYTPVGVKMTDQTRIAVKWAKKEVKQIVDATAILYPRIAIPPGKADQTYKAKQTIRDFIQVESLYPHMHSRGAAFRFELKRPGEDIRTLLNVPKYDFNWQHTYILAEPLFLSPGDEIHITAVFDNSANNPANPNPDETVYWGDQTWEEMMIGYVGFIEDIRGDSSKPE